MPPIPAEVRVSDEAPCRSEASSIRYEGSIEKSVSPIAGELTGNPFQVTAVWEGAVPRKATVDKVARPEVLTKTEELKPRTSAIERDMLSRNAAAKGALSRDIDSIKVAIDVAIVGFREE